MQAGTKYLSGHSDVMFGSMSVRDEALFRKLKHMSNRFGQGVGGNDCYMALRGLRTLGVRMRQHQETGLRIAKWLAGRPEVIRVVHPAFADHSGHEFWKRDYSGASGLFGALLRPVAAGKPAAMLEGMSLFKIGSSWAASRA